MMSFDLESALRKWRDSMRTTGTVSSGDIEELESHLRDSVMDLEQTGLNTEEAFLVAVHRLGNLALVGQEYSKVSTENLWRQMVLGPPSDEQRRRYARELGIVILLGLVSGLLGKLPALFGYGELMDGSSVYGRNLGFFALPAVAVYLVWKRSLSLGLATAVTAIFAVSAIMVNIYPWMDPGSTVDLTAIHLPIALWLAIGVAYGGSGWRRTGIRMDFIRFTGEAVIYAVLIGCGGVVLVASTSVLFELAGVDASGLIQNYLIVFGGLAIPITAVFLVERKKTVIENIAPVLARVFTPLFVALLASVLVTIAVSGGVRENRNILIWMDLLLVLVLGLVLYSMSAREEDDTMRFPDWLTAGLLVLAIVLDVVAILAVVFRLVEYGLSPNRIAALGENVLVLVNMAGLAVGYVLFALRRVEFERMLAWQTRYLPVYFVWMLIVALGFPPLFGFR